MLYSQYQITVNGSQSDITTECPGEQWHKIAEASDNRTIRAQFKRRLVTTNDPGELYPHFHAGDLFISRWEVIAEIESR